MSEVRHINDAKNRSTGKQKRRLRTDIDFELRSPLAQRILLILLAVLILIFCVYQIYAYRSHRKVANTETALSRTITKTINTEGFVLRAENVIPYSAGGTVVPGAVNGSKVGIGDTVARIYSSPDTAEKFLEYAYLRDELDYYQTVDQASGSAVSVGMELYNSNILTSLLSLRACVERNDLAALPQKVRDLSASVTKKQAGLGKTIDVGSEIASLTARLETLEMQLAGSTDVTTEQAGYYVNETDGFEEAGEYASVSGISVQGVEDLLNASPSKSPKNVGKLITEFNWYLVCCVPESDADPLTVGSRVKVFFTDASDREVSMVLKAKNEDGAGKTALVLSSDLMDSTLASLRKENVRIRVEEYSGYAVNKKAVRTVKNKEDNTDEIGVFIQLGNIARFRRIEIVYSDDNIVLASNKEEKNGYLRLYDEVIIEGTDLYDGKIID